jgi:hypothetical protein
MSKWQQGRDRNRSLRELTRYTVRRVWEGGEVRRFRIRPRGFDTVLFEIVRPEGCSEADFKRFADAIQTLSDLPPKD